MTIKTKLTAGDWRAFVRFVSRRAGSGPRARFARLFLAVGIGALIRLVSGSSTVGLHPFSVWMGSIFGILWVWSMARIRNLNMAPAPDGYILGPRELVVAAEGLLERSDRHESLFRWASVRSIERSGEHLFIMVDAIAGFIVPLRAFASDSQRVEFVSEVQRYMSHARAPTA